MKTITVNIEKYTLAKDIHKFLEVSIYYNIWIDEVIETAMIDLSKESITVEDELYFTNTAALSISMVTGGEKSKMIRDELKDIYTQSKDTLFTPKEAGRVLNVISTNEGYNELTEKEKKLYSEFTHKEDIEEPKLLTNANKVLQRIPNTAINS
jgi:phage anti-repressor protein